MAANIFRSIFFLLLTGGLQYVGLRVKGWPGASDLTAWRIVFVYVLPVLLLAVSYWQWRKIGAFKKRAWMAENPAQFSPDLIDCYVRFKGRIAHERPCRLPLSDSDCVYCLAQVIVEWQVKEKKPAKGMKTVRKPLRREQSADILELTDNNCQVYIKVEEFTKSCLCLHSKEKTQASCPSWAQAQDQTRYKTYQLSEHFILSGDSITAQGRLALNKDGRLFIKPTRRLEFPSFLVVQKQAGRFILDTAEKALHDAWNRRIRVAFLLLNAGLFIYFWR